MIKSDYIISLTVSSMLIGATICMLDQGYFPKWWWIWIPITAMIISIIKLLKKNP